MVQTRLSGQEFTVHGEVGKIHIHHWHVGDDIRVLVYNDRSNSIYFVTDSHGAKVWIKGFQLQREGASLDVYAGGAHAKITRTTNGYVVSSGDTAYPGSYLQAMFTFEQAADIVRAFGG